jgi:signal peptidase I
MQPSLCDADTAVIRRRLPNEDLRGKVVLAATSSGLILKRVIGTDGDRLRIVLGTVRRNDEPIIEPYICETKNNKLVSWPDPRSRDVREFLVPAEHVFLLGDSRLESGDSRTTGPIRTEGLRGVLVARLPKLLKQRTCGCADKNGHSSQ